LVIALLALAMFAMLFGLMHRKDSAIIQALNLLQPGMTESEVTEILSPLRHAKMATVDGKPAYFFYGYDEFVTVRMESDGTEERVTRVDREPDTGPMWDRIRRNWERRLK
jgi:hypothetical protein